MTHNDTRILLIDDEINALDHLRTALSSHSSNWTIEVSNNPQQALASIQSNPPSIVICDYRMPQMNGAELLREAERHHPFIHRFITADREELEILEDGIGSAFHYLPKPCPSERLVTEIQRCLAIEKWLGKDQIKQIVGSLGELPSLPSLYQKISAALDDPNSSIDDVGEVIATDITISAKILQIVNSSYFGFDETVSNITEAVGILGIGTVKNLVLAIQIFDGDSDKQQKAKTDKLWRHSMNVATSSKKIMLYETSAPGIAEGAYTAGLFHDIGKLIIQRAAPEAYTDALVAAQNKGIHPWQAESEILGCNHAEAGAYLLARWGLPVGVVESAALHHDPVNSSGSSFSALAAVFAANALCGDKDSPKDFENSDSPYNHPFIASIGKRQQWNAWDNIISGDEEVALAAEIAAPHPTRFDSPTDHSQLQIGNRPAKPEDPPKSNRKWIATGIGAAASIAFAAFLALNSSSDYSDKVYADWESGSFESNPNVAQDFEYDREKSSFEPISAEALIAESVLTEFEPITADELVAEAKIEPVAEVKFPKLNVTRIYHDLPIPTADVNSRLVRIGDRVSGADVIEINPENVVVQFEGEIKSYSLK